MEYRRLGRSGLRVSPLCLGTMMFGGPTSEKDSQAIIDRAKEAGLNFIDTADAYNGGHSEEVVGRAIRQQRESWVLATKMANPMGDGPNRSGLARRWVFLACDASLRRLGTDWIDVMYLHKEDLSTPLEETVGAIADLIRAGKIRYFGISNYRSWRLARICQICDELQIGRPVVSQPYYNAMNRMPEVEHLPACDYYGLGVVPYSPIARGVLSGKYAPGQEPAADTRAARQDKRMMQTEWRKESLEIAQTIKRHAEASGITAVQFAVAWVLNNRFVTAPIVGRAIRADRDHWVLASKMCNAMGAGPNRSGLSRRWMFQACEASLRRLGTDWIDIMYLHKEDHATPLEETVGAIADLIRAGRIRYFGISNYRSWRLARICQICDDLGIERPVVSQPYYNAMNRMPETEHLP
ncbi:MAG: aldo/keto reductase, partial [Geminicoccaceae bacterium]|nr:aldo/keto reductase [Geminicoccaceae bacterium]